MKQRRPRANNVIRGARIQAILQVRLDGAARWDILSFVSENEDADNVPWKMGKNKRHLSERTIERYIHNADAIIVENCKKLDPNAFPKHLAKLRNIYARAVNTGDLSNARGCLRDEAQLLDLFPAKRIDSNVTVKDDLDDMTPAELRAERRRLEGILILDRPHAAAPSVAGPS